MESKCGRPLGLQFHNATGNLYIADASHGLLLVGPKGGLVKVLATEAEGISFKFTNGLDVDQETVKQVLSISPIAAITSLDGKLL
jgi:hypothetical protein